jgi:hypothetical protein
VGSANKPNYIMKNSIPTLAVLLGPAAVAALLLSYRSEVNVDSVVGYASVIALVGLVALEYRLTWKRLFAR